MATTQELMDLYGVAWFGFDEESGNVVNKLESGYIGTLNGPIRTNGWNGKGKALKFDGVNDYMPSTIRTPIGEKTIRFKVKITAVPSMIQGCIFEDYASNANYPGLYAYINKSDMRFYFLGFHGTGQATKYSIGTKESMRLNEWYDILISYRNTLEGRGLSLYVNGEFIGDSPVYVLEDASNSSLRGLHFGALNFTSYRYWASMELDEFQVYNKALSPSDFTQERIFTKSPSGEITVLLNDRLKELPNENIDSVIKHGKIINEIEHAVDRGIKVYDSTSHLFTKKDYVLSLSEGNTLLKEIKRKPNSILIN